MEFFVFPAPVYEEADTFNVDKLKKAVISIPDGYELTAIGYYALSEERKYYGPINDGNMASDGE